MKYSKHKQLLLLFGFLIPTIWCGAHNIAINDGFSHINIKGSIVQGFPRENSIQATIDGHTLSVVFLENLGQVTVEVSLASGGEVETQSTPTPNGVNIYIASTGSYVVTFTLSNGDEYYGEFEVTD